MNAAVVAKNIATTPVINLMARSRSTRIADNVARNIAKNSSYGQGVINKASLPDMAIDDLTIAKSWNGKIDKLARLPDMPIEDLANNQGRRIAKSWSGKTDPSAKLPDMPIEDLVNDAVVKPAAAGWGSRAKNWIADNPKTSMGIGGAGLIGGGFLAGNILSRDNDRRRY